MLPESPRLSFDPVAEEYDASRVLPPDAAAKAAHFLRDTAGLAPGEILLDAGVGTGRFALPLAQLGVPVVGVDISGGMMAQLLRKRQEAERAGNTLALRLAQSDLRALPLASNSMQATLVVHILHLIVDWQTVLDEIVRVLKPGGVLLMAWESGSKLPTRDHYFSEARQRGILREHQGITNTPAIVAHLEARGAVVSQAEGEPIRWTTHWPVSVTLGQLERRIWSNLWVGAAADHAALFSETTRWAQETYGTLDVVEETETSLTVWTARLPG